MTTHERIIEAIMLNGWTQEEACKIKDELIRRKAIRIEKGSGQWNYTSGIFAEKEVQELALDIVNHPQPQPE